MKINLSKYEYAILVATLIILYGYARLNVTVHFFNHLFPALSVGFLTLILLERKKIDTRAFRLALPFLVWMYSIFPELFVEEGGMHPWWTNAFLFHEWFDHLLEISPSVLNLNFVIALVLAFYYFSISRKRETKPQKSVL